MSMIRVKNLTFGYEGSYENVFENVNFQMDTDWKLGFTGRNGRGKTTFLKLLTGQMQYSGSIDASVDFEYFPYSVQNPEDFAVDVIREIAPAAEDWRIHRELSVLGAEEALYRPFAQLSFGEQTKILLTALFLRENLFLLIDEPTNHLDEEGRRLLASYLKKKKGFILVSHDRAFLDGCIDHILAINKKNIEVQKGNFSSWYAVKEMQDNSKIAENERLKKDIRRLENSARRTSDWSERAERRKNGTLNSGLKQDKGYVGHKAAKMMSRSKSIENRKIKAAEEKRQLLKNVESQKELKILPLVFHSDPVAELRNVSVDYGTGQAVCSGVSFSVRQGERIALKGKNGSGKSSILKLICGEDISHSGELRINRQLIISSVPQSGDFLKGTLREYARSRGIEESLLKSGLRKMGFSREQFDQNMENFSSGQKKKVLITASLCERAHLYVWDEPLNFIDVISRMQIEELLLKYRPTLLFVEHDSAFCENIATKTVEIR